jgi:flagellar basal-body rod protein FlgF/flagellar basal-body rod protein FlgG
MDSGSYAACAGLLARSQQLDLVAQDLANANTAGYRSLQTTFQSALAKSTAAESGDWSASLNSFGVLGEPRVTRTAGNLESTGNPLDLAVEGDAFFAIQTPSGVRYTRDGQFTVSAKRTLVSREGYAVLGEQGAIIVPSGPLSVSKDGTVSVDGAVAGKVQLAQFPASAALRAEGSTYYSAPPGSAAAAVNSSIRQGMLESSNVNAATSAVQLIALQRTAQMLQRAMTTFHSDFDRIAAQDLPKV